MEVAMKTACRAQLTRVVNEANVIIDSELFNVKDALVQVVKIKSARENLKFANEKASSFISEDQMRINECVKILEYDEKAVVAIARLEQCIAEVNSQGNMALGASAENMDNVGQQTGELHQPKMSLYLSSNDERISLDIQPEILWDHGINKLSFSIKQTYTTEDARQLTVKQRRCIFTDEVKLKIDSSYSYTACTIECRMENIRAKCDCVPFFYPQISGFQSCSLSQLSCIADHLDEIKDITRCNCMLGCNNTIYETQHIAFEGNSSGLKLFFVSWPMVKYKREVLFGWVDLLVSFGGIAGLFLGFSLLSVIEFIYFYTLRACIAAFRERRYLDRLQMEELKKEIIKCDLSMTPYFISKPLPYGGLKTISEGLKIDTTRMIRKDNVS
ncbi:uncharacterized protein LOC126734644 [Anthonomus grandis grandis]|uniref:uncharacterized protein LOC126734644 n=1 Tax=Anthonomus grandis grandis TaxID=2921223 RepID=UPI002166B9C8|nr:uncharacterized protein LOC126734644 [Anthonomus grandis grandis]